MSLDRYRIMNACVALPQFSVSDIQRYADTSASNVQKFVERNAGWFDEVGTQPRIGAGRPETLRRLSDSGMQNIKSKLADLSSLATSLDKPSEPDILQLIDSKLVALETDDLGMDDRDVVIEELNDDIRAASIIIHDLGKRFGDDDVSAFNQTLASTRDRLAKIKPLESVERRRDARRSVPRPAPSLAATEPQWFKLMALSRCQLLKNYLHEWDAKLDLFVAEFGEWLEKPTSNSHRGVVLLVDSIDTEDDLTPAVERFFMQKPVDAACFRLERFSKQDRLDLFTRLSELTDDPRAQRARTRVVITSTPKDKRWERSYRTVALQKRDRWKRQMRGLSRNIAACNTEIQGLDVSEAIEYGVKRQMDSTLFSLGLETETQSVTSVVRALKHDDTFDTALCIELIKTASKFPVEPRPDMVRVRINEPSEDLVKPMSELVASMRK